MLKKVALAVLLLCALVPIATETGASPGVTTRVSVASDGTQANGSSIDPSIDDTGRFVAFSSYATNLVPGDSNDTSDVFLRDLELDTTLRASVDSTGTQANGSSVTAEISADGNFVAFRSEASNLVPGDTQGGCDVNNDLQFTEHCPDIFVHDRLTGTAEMVSVNSAGVQGNSQSRMPSISADGRYVAFVSHASNLVPGDTNGVADVFVRDRQTGTTSRVSVNSEQGQANNLSTDVDIGSTGRFVAFGSNASNLVPNDTGDSCPDTFPPSQGNCFDIFVHDRLTGETIRASVASNGDQAQGQSYYPAVSGDGQIVAFASRAQNLGYTGGFFAIFVHNRTTGNTSRIGPGGDSVSGNGDSYAPRVSDDGRFIALFSAASNLVQGDVNHRFDTFVHDRTTRTTARTSTSTAGAQGDYDSLRPILSLPARFVTFYSLATNLVANDSNFANDVFVHDLGDLDGDGVSDPFDLDTDSDGDKVGNPVEGLCGSDPLSAVSIPERVDTPGDDDGDTQANEPLPPGAAAYDCDGDGFIGSTEASIFAGGGNGDQDPCGINGWPSELNNEGASANKLDMADLGTFLAPVRRLGTGPGHDNYSERWDLSPGWIIGEAINIADLAVMIAGPSGFPPMFGGLRAYGNTCPYAP